MWFVTNKENKEILLDYKERIIQPTFEFIIFCSEKGVTTEKDIRELYNKTSLKNSGIIDYFISKKENNTFINLLIKLVLLDEKQLKEQYNVFICQTNSLENLNFNLPQYNHPVEIKDLFVNYFYGLFWSEIELWDSFMNIEFSRTIFHSNFKKENKLYACPYCDTDTISIKPNSNVEHFLPKEEYPFLSCTAENLISSCIACNLAEEGKGRGIKNPIFSPYQLQLGDSMKIELLNGVFNVVNTGGEEILNYIELLKLNNKYGSEVLRDRAMANFELQYEIISKYSKKEALSYLQNHGRINGLYFISRDILKLREGL